MRQDVVESIEELARQLPTRMGVKKELKKLPTLIGDDERVLQLDTGTYAGGNGLVVATDRRVLFLLEGLTRSRLEDFPFDEIAAVRSEMGMVTGTCRLTISTYDTQAEISNMSKAVVDEITEYVRSRAGAAQAAAEPEAAELEAAQAEAVVAHEADEGEAVIEALAAAEDDSVRRPESSARAEPAGADGFDQREFARPDVVVRSEAEPEEFEPPGFVESAGAGLPPPPIEVLERPEVIQADAVVEEPSTSDRPVGVEGLRMVPSPALDAPLDREIEGANIVVIGAFEPSRLRPEWFAAQGLLGFEETSVADVRDDREDAVAFATDAFEVRVTPDQLLVGTTHGALFPRLSHIVSGVLELHRPDVAKLGINRDTHFRLATVEAWREIARRLAPPENWDLLLPAPGMRSLAVQGARPDRRPGAVLVRVEPSVRVRPGIYIQVNDHFEVADPASPGGRAEATRILTDAWERSMNQAETICRHLLFGGI